MKSLIFSIIAASATLALSAASTTVTDIAPYVYPQNYPASPGTMVFSPDGDTYYAANADYTKILAYSTRTGEQTETLFDCASTRENRIGSYEDFIVSPDGSQILLITDRQAVYRRSSTAQCYVYEVRSKLLRPLSADHPRQQSPVFSPDSRMIAFVADNNIYLKKLAYFSEVAVTDDGIPGSIINGIPDWTYEEEFDTTCAMAWAPDSETLCFIKSDESRVPLYSLPLYEGTCQPLKEYALYPGQMSYKYPVAGEPNSVVTLHSYNVANRKINDIDLGDSKIEYIPRILYAGEATRLLAVTLNRDQNRMEIFTVNPKSTTVKSLLVEESKAWIDPVAYENLVITPKSVIVNSSRTGYNHLYEYSLEGSLLRTLTSGEYDVTRCYGADVNGSVYYQSTIDGATNRRVERIDSKNKITSVSPENQFAAITMSPAGNYYTLTVQNAVTPPKYTLCDIKDKTIRNLEDNAAMASRWASLPAKEFFTIPSDGYMLNAYTIKPRDFNPSRRYPVIMWLYNGPGSQEVLNRWALDWEYFATEKGFIVVCVDGRGTGGRGRAFQDVVYRNLGYYETIDQINAANWLAQQPYVDGARIGIAGWSYGGYETLMCIGDRRSPFAAAVAIAPVTDWRYYDTVYTERYMLTPRANADGYRASAPLRLTENVKCPLLIMFGTADDNVHPANSLQYVSKLQSEGSYCDMLVFPNMNHSINGCNARAVVYGRMIDYFIRNL